MFLLTESTVVIVSIFSYKNLIRDEDGDEYKATEFGKSQMYELNKKFKFVLLTNDDVIDKFKSDWLIVTVN